MITWFLDTKKFIPDLYVSSISDIPYTKLYEEGKRLILTDLDNTLISYKEKNPTKELFDWKNKLEHMGFEIIIISNSRKHRVKYFADLLGLKYVMFAKKPLKMGFKKAMKMADRKYKLDEIVELGDQLMTDVYGSRRMGLYTILVQAIDNKTEKMVTKVNRILERKVIKSVKKKYPLQFKENLERYVGE